jgi:hypothetical protein
MDEYYAKLVGKRITGIVKDVGEGPYSIGTIYGLQLSNGEIAWVLRDEEGNGPGFLSIEK